MAEGADGIRAIRAVRARQSRPLFLGANWKCSLEAPEEVDALVVSMNQAWSEIPQEMRDVVEISVHPPFVYLDRVRQGLDSGIAVGAQNIYDSTFPNKGNTGATTTRMLASLGVEWVLLGHSDRRNNLGETDTLIADKAAAVLNSGLSVCLTIGETGEQRANGETLAVLEKQLGTVAEIVPADAWGRVALAYEPVWAVGEGATPCAPDEAQRVHLSLREWMVTNVSPEAARALRLTYTGSVNEANAADYACLSEVDGFVIGRAGLDAAKLSAIVRTLAGSKLNV
uniref:Triosephosphate isomerase n=1 Tax=Octactis speculum TaxID=3111310 RepID=A0A7S2CUS3_9STRA|mmetsp:Transcript_39851/g.54282  ORF Transcript_39851/g.54282 Transcript_39851/m.54282 type:complete len:284 (+) Transcript_39851:19-870(+)|eukprot:CAMPEP_0185769042 /NCGR_PEP_ID=MMETSP1174-20130828/53333_1 /TAXON_ID=35687 /ORGANISM="Dictyocha speculum, Strain CCMP1381" /LENGTH=283 /DNA_ID=CAMNT_0028453983 /DNA_START=16 /DNA_END=867 /DNA_ORIENTATION=-